MNIDHKIQKYTQKLNYYSKLKRKQNGGLSYKIGDKVKVIRSTEFNSGISYVGQIGTIVALSDPKLHFTNAAQVLFDDDNVEVYQLDDLEPVVNEPNIQEIQFTKPQVAKSQGSISKKFNITENITLAEFKKKYDLTDDKYTFFYRKSPFPSMQINDAQTIGPAEINIIDDSVVYIKQIA